MSRTAKALLPVLTALVIWALPVPEGLTPDAMRYVAIFLGVVVGLILEPIPAVSIGVIGPYSSGPNPIFYGSGYLPAKDFWRLGAIFGLSNVMIAAVLGIPYMSMLS